MLFAPTHPNGDGSMTEHQRDQNTEVFARLLETPFELTVRHIGKLEDNGLWQAPGVTFVDGRKSEPTAQLSSIDVVVAAEGTFPTIAIAQGVPRSSTASSSTRSGMPGDEILFPERRPLRGLRPLSVLVRRGLIEDVIREAALSDEPIAAYKRRFIGEPYQPRTFVELFERVITDPQPTRLDATRARTTVAFAEELVDRPQLLSAYVDAVSPADDATLVLWAPGARR